VSGAAILAKAQSNRPIIQDFVPLADSLEWNLGQEYLRQRGNKAFLSDATPVPFVINNDGTLSRDAAEVFFASLLDAEEKGPLDDELFVLELGVGVGLFAAIFWTPSGIFARSTTRTITTACATSPRIARSGCCWTFAGMACWRSTPAAIGCGWSMP
jgi:hypothetical protein